MKKNNSRRDFIKVAGAGVAGLMSFSPFACSSRVPDRRSFGVGLQLYTIRDAMAEDPVGSLQKVADIGYKYVELANYSGGKFYGYAPEEFKKIIEDMGMEALSSHTQVEARGITLDNAKRNAEDHARLGVKYCVQPWVNPEDRNIESYKRMVAEWNEVGKIMNDVGIQFGYHNHNFEFDNINGIVPYYDIFMPELDADLVTMEIDIYWVTKAGQDPVEMFRKYPGRFKLFHMKDKAVESDPMFEVAKKDIAPVGAGVIDFKRVMAASDIAGMEHMFVEDDNQGNGKPFEGIETSIKNLTESILV